MRKHIRRTMTLAAFLVLAYGWAFGEESQFMFAAGTLFMALVFKLTAPPEVKGA